MTQTIRCGCGRVLTAVCDDSRSRPATLPGVCPRCEQVRSRVPDAYLIAALLDRRERSRRLAHG